MIIECGSCNSRFRLDASKITGRGARVRCRKCGEAITVMKDDVDRPAGAGAAGPAEPQEGLDLRSILRESMEAPTPAAETPAADALQSDFEKMLADAGKEADLETAAPPAAESGERPMAGDQTVDFGPEEELTFAQPGPKEPASTDGQVPLSAGRASAAGATDGGSSRAQDAQERPAAGDATREDAQPPRTQPPAPASSSEFMMSTADSLDFLKADYDQGGQKATLDISGNLRIAPAPGAGDTKVAPPLGSQAAAAGRGWPSAEGAGAAAAPPVEPSSRSDAIRSELAALGSAGAARAEGSGAAGAGDAGIADVHGRTSAAMSMDGRVPRAQDAQERPGAGSAGAAAVPPRPKVASPPPSPPRRETIAPMPSPAVRKAPRRKSPPLKRGQASQLVRPSVVLLLLLFFALAGGGAYLGFTSDGQKILRGLVPQIESLWLGGGKTAFRYEVGNLVGYYETNPTAGRMFVIKGQVTNEGQLRKTGVRVSATLLDAQNKKVAEKTVYAGNVFGGDVLRKATREKIEAAMSNPIGGGLANMDIPPGKSVPFMVVFFDAPDGIDSYRLEPRDTD